MDGCGKLTATRNHCQVLPMLHVTSLKVPLHFACADAETTDPVSHRFHGKPTLVAVTWRGGAVTMEKIHDLNKVKSEKGRDEWICWQAGSIERSHVITILLWQN